ncbi:MAG: hypothetical protein ABIO78_05540 [Thermoanaerobaculia bacterium]
MGFPCLRREGAFFASLEPATNALIVKLPADRVTVLIHTGTGEPFAPNGRVFREWIAIPNPRRRTWTKLLEEAWQFAAAQRSPKAAPYEPSRDVSGYMLAAS